MHFPGRVCNAGLVRYWRKYRLIYIQTSKEFPSTAIFHTEVEMVFGLERVVQGNDEGMVAGGEDLLLC